MKDELSKVRKAVDALAEGPAKAALWSCLAGLSDGGVTANSGGGGPTNPPEPPPKPK